MTARAVLLFAIVSTAACGSRAREPEASPRDLLEQAETARGEHNYGIAERLYRGLLELEAPPTSTAYLRLQLGRCLQAYRSFDYARLEYQRVLDEPTESERADDLKPSAQAAIAECFEAQGRWREALDAYLLSRDKYPSMHWCANCKHARHQRTLDAIARCIRRLDE